MVASLEYLLQRYADKTCTEEEKVQLMELLQQSDNDEDVQQLIDKMIPEWDVRHSMPDDVADAVLQAILQTGKAPVIPIEENSRRKYRVWLNVAAAAIIAVFLVGGGWLWLNRSSTNNIVKTIEQNSISNDVLPGGNKALLTLADGSTIVLDSAGNGVLAKQGNTQIIKQQNGQLIYNTTGEEGTSNIAINTLSTPRGGQYKLTLPDGSKVWLNAASSLKYPAAFIGNERKVEITGEAYFEIAPLSPKGGQKIPFIVRVNEMEVEVLGTHFNINGYEDEELIRTTLLEGSVKINTASGSKFLKPGQQAQLQKTGSLKLVEDADLEETMAWKNGDFQFENSDIKTVMRQLTRWYDVDVEYKGKVSKHFLGSISRNVNLSQVLNMLEQTGEVKFKIEGKKVIVMP